MKLLVALLLFAGSARAEVPVELAYYVDPSASLTIQQILERDGALPWVVAGREAPAFGATTARIWIKAKVPWESLRFGGEQSLFFEVDDAYISRIALYDVLKGEVRETMEAGTAVAVSRRSVDVLRSGFSVFRNREPKPGELYIFSIEGSLPLSFPLRVMEAPDYTYQNWVRVLVVGFYLGCLLLAGLTNLVIGLSLRSRLYLKYAGYVFTIFFMSLSATGLSVQLLWPDSPWWATREVIFFGIPALLFYVSFVREFLRSKELSPAIDRALLLCTAVFVARSVWLLFANVPVVSVIGMAASAVANLLVIPLAWLAVRRKTQGARFVYGATIFFNVAIVVFTLHMSGVLSFGLAMWLPFFGLLVEVVALSLALADRLRQANRDLARQRDAMVHADKIAALGRLAGELAHEISNPLAIIHGNAVLIGKAPTAPEVGGFANTIESTVNRISKLVRGMRTLSRDTRRDPFRAVALDVVLQDAWSLCAERARLRGVAFEVTGQDPSVQLRCRGEEICQVLVNLINNALDALAETSEPRLRLEALRREEHVEIAVVDNGPGVPEELREQVLEPFFTTKPPGKGLGLGLSISRTIVQNHGGELRLDVGHPQTRFAFTIPLWSDGSPGSLGAGAVRI